MNNTDDGYFDEQVAATYDKDTGVFDPAVVNPAVEFLARLAGDGKALEFGIGTGRIALPLAKHGLEVHGIDMSSAMVSKLFEKPGAADIGVTIGDFASTSVDESFSIVYLVFNTIMNLTTQAEQVACFQNAAAHLIPGGKFIVEVMIPRLQQLTPGESYVTYNLTDTHWDVDEYDVVTQGLVSHHVRVIDGNIERSSIPFRYVWPAELDLMARLAGMVLEGRWSGWESEPFIATSTSAVSVWKKVDE